MSSIPPAPVQSPLQLSPQQVITSQAWLAWLNRDVLPVLRTAQDVAALLASQQDNAPDLTAEIDSGIAALSSTSQPGMNADEALQLVTALTATQTQGDNPDPALLASLAASEGQTLAALADIEQRLAAIREFQPHAPSHQNGGGDEVAVFVAAPSAIPKAGGGGALDIAWIPNTTVVGAPGVDTQVPTEKAVRTAIAAGSGSFTLISRQVLAAPAATVSFGSLGAFSHLRLIINARHSGATNDDVYVQFNGDTAANYSRQVTYSSAGTLGAAQSLSAAKVGWANIPGTTDLAGVPGVSEATIFDYAGTVFHKMAVVSEAGLLGTALTGLFSGITGYEWASTAAITSILLGIGGGTNFITGSTFTLYGMA